MALWPFGKKKKKDDAVEQASAQEQVIDGSQSPVTDDTAEAEAADAQASSAEEADNETGETTTGSTVTAGAADEEKDADEGKEEPSAETATSATEPAVAPGPAVIEHDAVNGETGPFDGDNVDIDDFDFSDFATGILNLGSIQLPLPVNSQVQVEMGDQGPRMLHVVTEHGRLTPVAFAAPNSGGMWEESSEEIAEGMRSEGMPVVFEMGPWGREVVGRGDNGVVRIVGVEGPRWLYRVTLAAPHGKENELAELAREIIARSFVYRGTAPVLAGQSLPVELPAQLASQIQQAMQQQAQQAQQVQPVQPAQQDEQNQRPDNPAGGNQ